MPVELNSITDKIFSQAAEMKTQHFYLGPFVGTVSHFSTVVARKGTLGCPKLAQVAH